MHALFSVKRKGFTLIELLLVIGIIAILASIVIVAINPTRQLGQARDAQRRADVNTIINAIYQYSIDNNGQLPGTMSGSPALTTGRLYQICNCNSTSCSDKWTCGFGQTMVNLRVLSGSYVVTVPKDPQRAASATGTNYQVMIDASSRIQVCSPGYEIATSAICVTR